MASQSTGVSTGNAWRASARMLLSAALSMLVLSWIAIANGYPLMFFDSGSYLKTGFAFAYSLERPPFYGLAMAVPLRLGGTWAVALAQAALTVAVIGGALAAVRGRLRAGELAVACIGLAATSSLPWFVGQIMPDLATGLAALLLYTLLAMPSSAPRWRRVLLAAGLALAMAVHLSHVLLTAGLLVLGVAALLIGRTPWREVLWRALPALLAIVAVLLALCAVNYKARGVFKPSLSTEMFTLARLFDGRVAQPVLAASCARERLALCAARPLVEAHDPAQLPGQAYLWNPASPLWPLLDRDLASTTAEEAQLIRRTVAERPGAVIALAWDGWTRQLVTARAGQLNRYDAASAPGRALAQYRPQALPALLAARQAQGRLATLDLVPDRWLALLALLAVPLIAWRARARGNRALLGLTGLVLATLLANAAITGALSGPDDRYQSRVLWLLPLLAIAALLDERAARRRPAG